MQYDFNLSKHAGSYKNNKWVCRHHSLQQSLINRESTLGSTGQQAVGGKVLNLICFLMSGVYNPLLILEYIFPPHSLTKQNIVCFRNTKINIIGIAGKRKYSIYLQSGDVKCVPGHAIPLVSAWLSWHHFHSCPTLSF